MKNLALCLAALAVTVSLTSSAHADTAGISFSAVSESPLITMNNGTGYSLGYSFTTLSATDVTGLGYFDDGGLTEVHSVGLYNSNGTLLASTTVTGNGTQVGFFNFNAITPISLAAGGTYQVVGTSGFIDNYTFDTTGFSVEPTIQYDADTYSLGNTLKIGQVSNGITAAQGGGYFGANFETDSAAVTPEPSSLLLLGTGAMGLLGLVRRRVQA